MITETELKKIHQRCENTSIGPWGIEQVNLDTGAIDHIIYSSGDVCALHEDSRPDSFLKNQRSDAEFIAHARTDIPRLLDHISSLEQTIRELRYEKLSPEKGVAISVNGQRFKYNPNFGRWFARGREVSSCFITRLLCQYTNWEIIDA